MIPQKLTKNKKLLEKAIFLVFTILVLSGSSSEANASSYSASLTSSPNVNLTLEGSGVSNYGTEDSTLVVSTNCPNGFSVLVSTDINDNNLYLNGDKNSEYSFSPTAGTFLEPKALSNNSWGVAVEGDKFVGVSHEPGSILNVSASGYSTYSDNIYNVSFGATNNGAIASGNYYMADYGQIVYTLELGTTCVGYSISYDKNSDSATGTTTEQSDEYIIGDSIVLSGRDFFRDDRFLVGWSFDKEATPDSEGVYRPGSTITFDSSMPAFDTDNDRNLVLYAVWGDFSYLKVMSDVNGTDVAAFDNPHGIPKEKIEKVYTIDTLALPSELATSAIQEWDVSANQDMSIKAYALDTDSDSMYEIYIGQDGGVMANPNSYKLFNYYTNLEYADLSNLIMNDATTMRAMFQNDGNLVDIVGEENWNTSKVTDMGNAFRANAKLTGLDAANWDVSKVTSMASMFEGDNALARLDTSRWTTSSLTNVSYMFSNCRGLTSLNVASWDTSNVTTMKAFFAGMKNLTELTGEENLVTSNVTDMMYLFTSLEKITDLNIGGWDMSNVKDMAYMFYECFKLANLDTSRWVTDSVEKLAYTFYHNYALTSLDTRSWNTSNVTHMGYMFGDDTNLEDILGEEGWDVSNVVDFGGMFAGCKKLTNLDIDGWHTDSAEVIRNMFYDCESLVALDLSGWDVSKVDNLYGVFYDCKSLETLDVHTWDVSKVNDMGITFSGCSSLVSLDLRGWDVSKVEYMEMTFDGDTSLTEILGTESWQTPSIRSMRATFNHCNSLAHIDISSWTMPSNASTRSMFQYDSALETITMPSNYTRIDSFMFNHNSSWAGTTFTIPSTVEFVGNSHVFYNFGTQDFNKFVVEEGNTAVKTINDVLYSYDGTRLISIPRAKTFDNVTFEIPEGVTMLNELSFSRNYNIGTVVLPNSYEITNTLPDGFINTGNNLSVAIYGYTAVSKYEVKEDNPRYISNQGCIYSKDGTELIAVPLQYTGSLTIPEGTTSIRAEAFWEADNMFYTRWMTELNIPASLTSIDEEQLSRINTIVYYKNIPINVDPANPAFEVVDGKLVAK